MRVCDATHLDLNADYPSCALTLCDANNKNAQDTCSLINGVPCLFCRFGAVRRSRGAER